MAGRPPLPVGSDGKIRVVAVATGFRAFTRFRDYDGVTRPVSCTAPPRPSAR